MITQRIATLLSSATLVVIAVLAPVSAAALTTADSTTSPQAPGIRVLNRDNYAGYIMSVSGGVRKVSGVFNVPRASCPTRNDIATEWIGMTNSRTVGSPTTIEQAGVFEVCGSSANSPVTYFVFAEVYPRKAQQLFLTVKRGDTVEVDIAFRGHGHFLFTITDINTDSSESKTISCPAHRTCDRNFAEAVGERLHKGNLSSAFFPLPKLGPVTYMHLQATNNKGVLRGFNYFEQHHALSRFDMRLHGNGEKLFQTSSPQPMTEGFTIKQLHRV